MSGGRDSLVLLHALRFGGVSAQLDLDWVVAHVDHAMRPESTDDADWLEGLARAWAVPFYRNTLTPPPLGETEARLRRYAALGDTAAAVGAKAILTAHHRGDQVETILFRILRGTGVRGLAGIPASRPFYPPGVRPTPEQDPSHLPPHLVRPLLEVTPAELDEWAAKHALRPRIDPTNQDPKVTARNRLRVEVLPALRRRHSRLEEKLWALGRAAREREDALAAYLALDDAHGLIPSGRRIELDRAKLLRTPVWLRAERLRAVFRNHGIRPTRRALEGGVRFLETAERGAGFDVGGGVRLVRSFDRFVVDVGGSAPPPDVEAQGQIQVEIQDLTVPGSYSIPTRSGAGASLGPAVNPGGVHRRSVFRWGPTFGAATPDAALGRAPAGRTAPMVSAAPGPAFWTAVFPSGILKGPLTVRTRRPGDRVRVSWDHDADAFEGKGSVRVRALKKLLSERRVFRGDRDSLPLLVDAEGLVIWVPGVWKTRSPAPLDASSFWTIGVWDDVERE